MMLEACEKTVFLGSGIETTQFLKKYHVNVTHILVAINGKHLATC